MSAPTRAAIGRRHQDDIASRCWGKGPERLDVNEEWFVGYSDVGKVQACVPSTRDIAGFMPEPLGINKHLDIKWLEIHELYAWEFGGSVC